MDDFLKNSSFLKRLLTEGACIEMLEERIRKAGMLITHDRAIIEWNLKGYHSRFSSAYSDEKTAQEVFALV